MGLHLGLGDDIFGSNFESNLLKDEEKHEDVHQRAAFPIMDAFKEHTLLTADDLKEKVENGYSDQEGIQQAVDNALRKLHKKKAQVDTAAHPGAPHVVTAKELIDEVVKQEIASHLGTNNAIQQEETNSASDDDLKSKLHQKLEEITRIETKLFSLIRDVKGFLMKKKSDQGEGKDDSLDGEDSDLADNVNLDGLVSKRSEIPSNINRFRRNETLVENFIRDALKDDFTVDPSEYDESHTESSEDKKAAKQGDTRDLLGKEEMQKALLKQAVPGEIENIPVSSLEREVDENDSVASDHGITRDALVDSPFSSLDYKKVTGTRSRHFLS